MIFNALRRYLCVNQPPEFIYIKDNQFSDNWKDLTEKSQTVVSVYKLDKQIMIGRNPTQFWQREI